MQGLTRGERDGGHGGDFVQQAQCRMRTGESEARRVRLRRSQAAGPPIHVVPARARAAALRVSSLPWCVCRWILGARDNAGVTHARGASAAARTASSRDQQVSHCAQSMAGIVLAWWAASDGAQSRIETVHVVFQLLSHGASPARACQLGKRHSSCERSS